MKAAIAGIVRAFERGVRRVPIQAQATLDSPRAACCSAPTSAPIVRDAGRAADRRHRAQLFDRAGADARLGALPVENSRCFVSVIPNAGLPLMGPQGETIYPETPERDGARTRRVRSRFRRQRDRRLLRHDARAHGRDSRPSRSSKAQRRRAARALPRAETAGNAAASAMTAVALEQEPAAVDRRRADQHARLAQDQASAARRRLRRDRARRARAGRGRRARARRLHGADRARRRGRADARGRAQARAVDRSAADDRLDRAARHRRRRCRTIPAARSSIRSIWRPAAPRSTS